MDVMTASGQERIESEVVHKDGTLANRSVTQKEQGRASEWCAKKRRRERKHVDCWQSLPALLELSTIF